MSRSPQTDHDSKRAGRSPKKKKAALWWLIGFLAIAMGVFVYVTPVGHRIRVVVAFAVVTPLAVSSLFYVLRDE